jgi:hypothetical protein
MGGRPAGAIDGRALTKATYVRNDVDDTLKAEAFLRRFAHKEPFGLVWHPTGSTATSAIDLPAFSIVTPWKADLRTRRSRLSPCR